HTTARCVPFTVAVHRCLAHVDLSSTFFFSFYYPRPPPDLHSFPTRRSSDLLAEISATREAYSERFGGDVSAMLADLRKRKQESGDRKSTRLNSSHLGISYAVFCLKKKNST